MDKSKRPILDEFGMALVTQVRDDACGFLQRLISGKMADNTSKELFKRFSNLTPEDAALVERLLLSAVDAGIVRFLHFLDENEIEILFRDKTGKKHDIRAISDGLAGEIHMEDGWFAKYSKFRDRIEPVK